MIDLTINQEILDKNIEVARENNVIIPTYEMMLHPEKIPAKIKEKLKDVDMWDTDPLNLFRITWKNEPVRKGGTFGEANYFTLPKELTGVDAKIIFMVGKYFPTGCHKVGASFSCLVPRLVTGQFDARTEKAVWPSTGNYCRGGAFNSKILGVKSVAILPEGMSRERFEWLEGIADEVIGTPGTESNVKEIFDMVKIIKATRPDAKVFNQFEEMGNYMWHYNVTGPSIQEAFQDLNKDGGLRFAGVTFTSGSGGTMAAGDYLKKEYPASKIAVGEALQCPTLLNNGFGAHRIEGIGDKHVPWVHNVKRTNMVIDIDDNDSMALLRLFNEPAGHDYLREKFGIAQKDLDNLALMGISGITNLLCAIKFAKYYELTEKDVVATVLTDSVEMYQSRLEELRETEGEYDTVTARYDYIGKLLGQKTDNLMELTYADRKRLHNQKYYTWVEQQGKTSQELDELWYNQEGTYDAVAEQVHEVDRLINEFNEKTGLLESLS